MIMNVEQSPKKRYTPFSGTFGLFFTSMYNGWKEENAMTSRMKITSGMLLVALVVSLLPALTLPSSASAATCDQAQFVADVTVPDGTKFEPGAAFKKTWRLKNIGTCTWTTSYSLVFDSGAQMGAPASVKFPSEVKPGQTIDLSVDMTAPTAAGRYIGYWKFKNASGTLFGIGATANKSWWVEINVTSSAPGGSLVFDFAASAKDATWSSGAGGLTFPGTDGNAKGFALLKDKPKFESGVELSKPSLLFAPQNITNGFIQAEYPAYKVDAGDTFQTTVGCEFGATSCYVTYRLDYKIGNTIKTFWTFRERYEGLTYNANISLAPLAGQEVKFILYISASGSPSGDRALWGNPVITRKGIVPPPPTATGTPPTATPSKTPAPITPTVPPSACDKVQFVADVNFPDGTVVQPGAQFTKTWRLKNVGTCVWKKDTYQLVFFSGERMGGASSAVFTKDVAIGETVDISVNLTAPASPGIYRGYWMFKNASGALFGIGAQANKPWWVEIKVTGGPTVTPAPATPTQGGPTSTPPATPTPQAGTAYDFAANACAASWFSGAQTGALPCPGTDGDAKGFVLKVTNPKLENGSTDPRQGLITFPQNKQDGYIQGIYPAFTVQSGDRFQSTINCAYGATNCYVVFRLDYQTGSDPIKTFWGPFLERYEGGIYNVDVDLTPLAGKDVKFILTALAYGSPSGDRALWVGPRIYRAGSASTPLPATATQSPASGLDRYFNSKYGFEFKYPAGAPLSDQSDDHVRIALPIVTAGTNLSEKYLDVTVSQGLAVCRSPDIGGDPSTTETVTINGIQFFKESGAGAGAGNIYEFVAYSTETNNTCVSLTFILHSTNPGNYPTPPPVFDKAAESAIFDQIINTFDWTG
jgi:hypothetical protein